MKGVERPKRRFEPTVDLWSMAVTFFEVTTGRRPFLANSAPAMFALISNKPKFSIGGFASYDGSFRYIDFFAGGHAADPNYVVALKPLLTMLLKVNTFLKNYFYLN